MIEELLKIDRDIFVFFNSMGSETFDAFWLLITKKTSWIPVFALILYLVFKHLGWRHALLIIVIIALLLTVTDQTTNLFKKFFQRLRPGNNPELAQVMRIVQKRNSYSFFWSCRQLNVGCFIPVSGDETLSEIHGIDLHLAVGFCLQQDLLRVALSL